MAKIDAYVSIEETVGSTLYRQWRERGKEAAKKLTDAVQAKKFNDAYDLIRELNLHDTVTAKKDRLRELGVSAMLFGAGNLVPVKYTQLAKSKKIPEELDLGLAQLEVMVEENGTDLLTRRVSKIVQAAEEEWLDELYAVSKAEFNLADALNNAVLGTGRAVFDVGANLTTSRLVSFGFLDEAVFNQITTYQVTEVLDTVTCPVCQVMHGKMFEVAKEHSRVLTVLRIQDPNELKSAAPWPKQSKAAVAELKAMSETEMQDKGFGSPPYHPGCRGILVMAGTVTEKFTQTKLPLLSTKPKDKGPVKLPETPVEQMLFTVGYDISDFSSAQLVAIRELMDDGVPAEDAVKQVLATT